MAYQYDFQIGTLAGGTGAMANVESLGTGGLLPPTAPRAKMAPYADYAILGDNTTRGLGAPQVDWEWGIIDDLQRDALREFCTGASAVVLIKTQTNENEDEYKTYQAVMNWPQGFEERDATRRIGFTISFRQLVEVS